MEHRPLPDDQLAWSEDGGHGRAHDRRELRVIPIPPGRSDWPGLAQVFQLVRTWQERGVSHHSIHYGITSLSPQRVSAAHLLALRRGHWIIENALHRQKDVLFHEDASQVYRDSGAAVLSLLRDAAITLLHLAGHHALALVCHPIPTRA